MPELSNMTHTSPGKEHCQAQQHDDGPLFAVGSWRESSHIQVNRSNR